MSEQITLNGRKSVEELIEDKKLNHLIDKVFITNTQKHLIDKCKEFNIQYEIKHKDWFNRLKVKTKYKNALATLKQIQQPTFKELLKIVKSKEYSLIVMLDKIQDPHNFGAILRTCAAANVDAVIYSKHEHCPINSVVLKSSQGYGLKTKVIGVVNMSNALFELQKCGFWSYSTNLSQKAKDYKDVSYYKKSILIFGNEGYGVSKLLNERSDYEITIPLSNNVDSLNVSVCAGIIIFDYLKNNNKKENIVEMEVHDAGNKPMI